MHGITTCTFQVQQLHFLAALNDVAIMQQSCTQTRNELAAPCLQMFLFQDGAVPQGEAGNAYKGVYLCEEKITQVAATFSRPVSMNLAWVVTAAGTSIGGR